MFRTALPLIALVLAGRVALAQATSAEPKERADSLAAGRLYTRWLFAHHADSIFARMTEKAKAQFGSVDKVAQTADAILRAAGTETAVVSEQIATGASGGRDYRRTSMYSIATEPFTVRWLIGANGDIVGFGAGPARMMGGTP